jgi:hypothetical protein
LEDTWRQIAAKEDAMAVKQSAQLAGPGWLVRPKPRPLAKKTAKTTLDTENAVYTSTTLGLKPCKQALYNPTYYCKDLLFGSVQLVVWEWLKLWTWGRGRVKIQGPSNLRMASMPNERSLTPAYPP